MYGTADEMLDYLQLTDPAAYAIARRMAELKDDDVFEAMDRYDSLRGRVRDVIESALGWMEGHGADEQDTGELYSLLSEVQGKSGR